MDTIVLGKSADLWKDNPQDQPVSQPAEEQMPSYSALKSGFSDASQLVDDIILKKYLHKLSDMNILPLAENQKQLSEIRLFKITEMVYQKDEYSTYKFASVFSALQNLNCGIFIIADSDGEKTEFYMGVRALDDKRTTKSLKDSLRNALIGQFPGVKTENLLDKETQDFLNHIPSKDIAMVSCVANNKDEDFNNNQSFIQGLEKLALAMQGQVYTAVVLAKSTTAEELDVIRQSYEMIYTQLSPFANMQLSYGTNEAISISNALSHGATTGTSSSQSYSESKGTSDSTSSERQNSTSKSNLLEGLVKVGGTLAIAAAGIAAAPFTAGTSMIAASAGQMLLSAHSPSSKTTGSSYSTSSSTSHEQSKSQTYERNSSTSETTTQTQGITSGKTDNMQLTMQNKSILNTMDRIEAQLKRIDECESIGMWECAAYFLSDSQETAEMAAGTYKALMKGENSGLETSAINFWGRKQKEKTTLLRDYVTNFIHPVFEYAYGDGYLPVTPAALVSSNELAILMGLPRKSVCGFPVLEHADFGKEVVNYSNQQGRDILHLGKIFNMGAETDTEVNLDLQSLSMHTFITGSTGSGKSNTVYLLLNKLSKKGIHFMVIEPAKGEYKNMFGFYPDVQVYGTNPQYTNLLKINPFKFSEGIHVLEHVDRLIEIFNVCWPMYAAMPSVLKDAVLQAYTECGWDLIESKNRYNDNLFPTFSDLLNELVAVIKDSAYSEEVKSNYTGSLVTRIRSLTNGLNGQIFSTNEIDNNELFDKNTIIDLSRVGSTETKSLIMGILIMRLSEYRMSSSKEMNASLHHITVLEEAHNILKRTSTEQNLEGANVAGKSVEMISNAIAEMRTYGEGFIIADQSPSAVDISAIRNTNTKIIMRLPDEQDQHLAGKSAGLKDNQLDEIAKLPKGVAVIYQNDWLEPVLCKMEKYDGKEKSFKKVEQVSIPSASDQKKMLIRNLLNKNSGKKLELSLGELTVRLTKMDIPTTTKIKALKALRKNNPCSIRDISSVIYDLICDPITEKEAENVDSIEEWKNVFLNVQDSLLASFDVPDQNKAVECILCEQILRYNKPAEYLNAWHKFLQGEAI